MIMDAVKSKDVLSIWGTNTMKITKVKNMTNTTRNCKQGVTLI